MANGDSRFRSRRFLFACFVEAVATIGLFTFEIEDPMDKLRWWRDVSAMVIGLYAMSSFAEKKVTVGGGGA